MDSSQEIGDGQFIVSAFKWITSRTQNEKNQGMDSPSKVNSDDYILVLFDGVCNLCNGAVQFIIKRDPSSKFRFASLQSDYAISQMKKYGIDPVAMHSIIVIDNGRAYDKSDAAFKIAANLNGVWRIAAALRFIPKIVRDGVYDFIASRRYKLFGKRDSCMLPDDSISERFWG